MIKNTTTAIAGALMLSCILLNAAPPSKTAGSAKQTVADDIARLQQGEDDSSIAGQLMKKGRAALEKGHEGDAQDYFEEIVDEYPDSEFAPAAYFEIGNIYADENRFESAFDAYKEILDRYPNFEHFNALVEQIYDTGKRILDGERPYYWGVIPGFRDYNDGTLYFDAIIAYAPYSDYAALSLMNNAKLKLKEDEPEEAIQYLDRLINQYPDSAITPDSYLLLGDTFSEFVLGPDYDQEATNEAIRYYRDYLLLFPDHPNADEARAGMERMRDILARSHLELGEFYYFYRSDNRAALIFLNEAITTYPNSTIADRAQEVIQRIESGELPPKTPVDFVFGRAVKPRDKILKQPPEVEPFEPEPFEPAAE